MNTHPILDKISAHWTHYLELQGKNPLKHCLKSHYDWYVSSMEPDPEIDQYFDHITKSTEYVALIEKIKILDELSQWVANERIICSEQFTRLLK